MAAALVLPNVIVTTTGSPRDRTVAIGRNPPKRRTLTNFRNVNSAKRMVVEESVTELSPSIVESLNRQTSLTPSENDPKKLFEVIKTPSLIGRETEERSSILDSTVKRANRRPVKSAFVRRPKTGVTNKGHKVSDDIMVIDKTQLDSKKDDDTISVQLQLQRKLSYRDILRKLFDIWEPQLSESYRPFVHYVPSDDDDRLSCISMGSVKSKNSHVINGNARTKFRVAETAIEAVHKFDSQKAERRKSLYPR